MVRASEERIDPGLSLILDLLRFGAAVLVVVSHLSTHWLGGGWLWQAGDYGDAAVMLFFVLSGYVIAATVETTSGAKEYAVARLSRLYSVVLPVLIATASLDALGAALNPEFYLSVSPAARPFDIGTDAIPRYLASAVFVQEWWSVPLALPWPGSNSPFWSLSFEASYYAAFGLMMFATGAFRVVALAVLALLVGPEIIALFPIWLLGVAIRRYRHLMPGFAAWPMFGAGVAMVALFVLFRPALEAADRLFPVLNGMHLISRYAVASGIALLMLGAAGLAGRFGVGRLAGPVRRIADHTFELYLLHVPVAVFLAAVLPGRVDAPWRVVSLYAGVAAATMLAAKFTTPLKAGLRRAGAKLFSAGDLRWIK